MSKSMLSRVSIDCEPLDDRKGRHDEVGKIRDLVAGQQNHRERRDVAYLLGNLREQVLL